MLIVSSHYPVGQPSMYDACAENSLVAAIICQEGIDKEGGSRDVSLTGLDRNDKE